MEMVRFSISIPIDMRKTMEELAVANFRNLNGEIAKALDLYIKGVNGQIVAPEPIYYQPRMNNVVIQEEIQENKTLNLNSFGEDEVEEF